MSASLLEALQGLVTPALLKTASSALGESEGGLTSGLGAIVSKILGALVAGTGDQSLMGKIADLVTTQSRDPGALSDVAGLLSSGVSAIAGNQLIGSLFGVKEGGIAQAAAAAAGLKPQSGAALMALAGPLVLSGLGKASGGSSLTGAALASLLNTQRASLLGSLAPAAAATASSAAAAGVAAAKPAATTTTSAPAATAASAAPTAVSTASAAAESSGAGIGWLVWPLLLLALAGIGYFLWETKYSELKSQPPAPVKVEEKKAEPKAAPAPEKNADVPAAAPAPAAQPAAEPAPAATP